MNYQNFSHGSEVSHLVQKSLKGEALMDQQQQIDLANAFIAQLEAKEKHYSMADTVEDASLENAYLVQDSLSLTSCCNGESKSSVGKLL